MVPWWERRGKRPQSQRHRRKALWRRGATPHLFYVHHKPKTKNKTHFKCGDVEAAIDLVFRNQDAGEQR